MVSRGKGAEEGGPGLGSAVRWVFLVGWSRAGVPGPKKNVA